MRGTLSVVATPIGNLGDLSERAREVLTTADLVLAEDTRHTGRLLAHLGSEVPQRSLHEHNEDERIGEVLARLEAGEHLALVSDAGTPTVSDPGYRLLAACADAGVTIVPIPGASALLAALVASGLPTDRVAFDGFLPRKGATRRARLAEIAREPRTVVLYLSPHRAAADLRDLAESLGEQRRAALCRELTKLHEEIRRGSLGELASSAADGVRGEVTLVIAGAEDDPAAAAGVPDLDTQVAEVAGLMAAGSGTKDAVAEVVGRYGGSKRVLYQAVLDARAAARDA
ncbi:MAG: 16S rRNA (cytidine(1402)-2'-O)-methyltransferase [Nitriliruptor sp.]|nr:MAG: 16S rRNA (cytidine(1402)-2'-O)-methyltransferase [Nitriliruptor sp.]